MHIRYDARIDGRIAVLVLFNMNNGRRFPVLMAGIRWKGLGSALTTETELDLDSLNRLREIAESLLKSSIPENVDVKVSEEEAKALCRVIDRICRGLIRPGEIVGLSREEVARLVVDKALKDKRVIARDRLWIAIERTVGKFLTGSIPELK